MEDGRTLRVREVEEVLDIRGELVAMVAKEKRGSTAEALGVGGADRG